jgi:Fe-S-cluster containining protein
MTAGAEGVLRRDFELVQIVDAAFADAAQRSGPHLVCRPGCTQCCYGAFAINALDALRLRHAMSELSASDPALAAQIRERARRYLAEFGSSFPGDPVGGILDTSEAAQEAFEEFANEAACPALNPETGLCEVYAARPMTCRVFGPPVRAEAGNVKDDAEDDLEGDTEGLAVCELCFTEATPEEIAAAEMRVPHAEEARLLQELAALDQASQSCETMGGTAESRESRETIVAYCLVEMPRATAS